MDENDFFEEDPEGDRQIRSLSAALWLGLFIAVVEIARYFWPLP